MLYRTPQLSSADHAVLDQIARLREKLRHHLGSSPRRWQGVLRRNSMARAIQGSNSIEGYHATLDDVAAAIDGDQPLETSDETWLEILGYRNALTYILQLAEDPHFELSAQLVRALHFMMLQHSIVKMPGRWRTGDIYVVNELTRERVYQGPDAMLVPELTDALVGEINKAFAHGATDESHIVIAAMAHLNLTMIHPFKDGNGRMSRALQTLVLSRSGTMSPVFSSIEEWLGRHTLAYYEVLAQTGRGTWNPPRSAHEWVRFCLRAHYQQVQTLVERNELMGQVFEAITRARADWKLPERTETTLVNAALGMRVTARTYRSETELSDVVASRDLRRMCEVGLLVAHGDKRGRYYFGDTPLLAIAEKYQRKSTERDPYRLVKK